MKAKGTEFPAEEKIKSTDMKFESELLEETMLEKDLPSTTDTEQTIPTRSSRSGNTAHLLQPWIERELTTGRSVFTNQSDPAFDADEDDLDDDDAETGPDDDESADVDDGDDDWTDDDAILTDEDAVADDDAMADPELFDEEDDDDDI